MEPVRLLCLPYAGASAQSYARWRRRLPAHIEPHPVELPGRGARDGEPFATDARSLANQLADELVAGLTRSGARFAIFGHSLGALVGFELAHSLEARGRAPCALLVSGSFAPAQRHGEDGDRVRDDAALVEQLRAYQGTSPEVFASPELLALALPVLRADLRLGDNYRYVSRPPLQCALHVYGGTSDKMGPHDLMAWRGESRSTFTVNMFEGGHFYFRGADEALLGCVVEHLNAAAPPRFDVAPPNLL